MPGRKNDRKWEEMYCVLTGTDMPCPSDNRLFTREGYLGVSCQAAERMHAETSEPQACPLSNL